VSVKKRVLGRAEPGEIGEEEWEEDEGGEGVVVVADAEEDSDDELGLPPLREMEGTASAPLDKKRKRTAKSHERPISSPPPPDHGFDQYFVPVDIPEGTTVWGIDPGRRDPIYAVSNKGRTYRVSLEHYYQMCGFTAARKRREKWLRQARTVQQALNRLSDATYKTSALATFDAYLEALLPNLSLILDFYFKRRHRRSNFDSYIRTQRAWQEITQPFANSVVALGAALFAHNSRGHATGPLKKLRQKLKDRAYALRLIGEFNTSRVCHLCEGFFDQEKQRRWSLRVCRDVCGGRIMNRDFNAAKNILEIFLYMNTHAEGTASVWYPNCTFVGQKLNLDLSQEGMAEGKQDTFPHPSHMSTRAPATCHQSEHPAAAPSAVPRGRDNHQPTLQLLLESAKHEFANVLYGSILTVVIITVLIVLERYYEEWLVGYQSRLHRVFGFYVAWIGFAMYGFCLVYTLAFTPLLHRMLVVTIFDSILLLADVTLSIHLLYSEPNTSFPTLAALVNALDWTTTSIINFFVNRSPLGWSKLPKRVFLSMCDGVTWILCTNGILFCMCAAFLAGKALSGSPQGSGDGVRRTGRQAASVVVFGLGMPVFRALFTRYVVRLCLVRVGLTAATSMEVLKAGGTVRSKVEDVEDLWDGKMDVCGPSLVVDTEGSVDGQHATKAGTGNADGGIWRCPSGNIISVDKNEIVADPGLVRMIVGFESGFSMVDTIIILQNQNNTTFALSIVGSHAVHLVQCFLRGRRWRQILEESKLRTGGIAAGFNTWITMTTAHGVATYITTIPAMVMTLLFDMRGVLSSLHAHPTKEQVAVRTVIAMVLQIVVGILLTAYEIRRLGVPFQWRRVKLPMFARVEAAAMAMVAVGAFLMVERGVFGTF
ncbi:hypothetical protein HK104_010414, partial [Borealophlyctis nickersoniae]